MYHLVEGAFEWRCISGFEACSPGDGGNCGGGDGGSSQSELCFSMSDYF